MKKLIIIIYLALSCASVQKSNALKMADDFIRSSAKTDEKISFLRNVIADQDEHLRNKDNYIQDLSKELDRKNAEIKSLHEKISVLSIDAGLKIGIWQAAKFLFVTALLYAGFLGLKKYVL